MGREARDIGTLDGMRLRNAKDGRATARRNARLHAFVASLLARKKSRLLKLDVAKAIPN